MDSLLSDFILVHVQHSILCYEKFSYLFIMEHSDLKKSSYPEKFCIYLTLHFEKSFDLHGFIFSFLFCTYRYNRQGYTLKNWVEGISDKTYYPWESPKKFD